MIKIEVPIILLANLCSSLLLSNGMRLIVNTLNNLSVESEIITETHIGNRGIIQRITLSPSDSEYSFNLKRR